jgi:nucleoside-diphosphate-sugar epimerase
MNFGNERRVVLVTGTNGVLGSAVAERLVSKGCKVLGVTRPDSKKNSKTQSNAIPNFRQISIENVLNNSNRFRTEQRIKDSEQIFLVNCGWGGLDRLTDGGLSNQLENVANISNLIRAAAKFGVTRIVHIGTFEEDLLAKYLSEKDSSGIAFQSGQVDYAIAKTIARDIGILDSYLSKMDFVQVRFSVVVDHRVRYKNYVNNCVDRIRRSMAIEVPSNKGVLDVIHHDDLVDGIMCSLLKGQGHSNYYLGVAHPMTLDEFFSDIQSGSCMNDKSSFGNETAILNALRMKFISETGFEYKYGYKDIILKLANNAT